MRTTSPFLQRGQTPYAAECMEKIREMMAHPRAPGNWWAKEIMSKVAAGKPVSLLAYDVAKKALGPVEVREPGSDDEELAA